MIKFLNTKAWAASAALCAMLAFASNPASAAFISFTEDDVLGTVVVARDNNDWLTFSSSSTAETATVDATLFKFSAQGSTPGIYGYFLSELGVLSDVLIATVTNLDQFTYAVHYEFFSDPALPNLTGINFSATFDQEELPGGNSFPLPSYSHQIVINSGTAELPEPGTLGLLGLALLGVGAARRRK